MDNIEDKKWVKENFKETTAQAKVISQANKLQSP